jgi:hypothetical protein
MEGNKIPRVFVSYSHDSPDHKDWVREFSEELVKNGIDVILDQWDVGLGDDLPKFMENSLGEVDRVLMICTPAYVIKANDGTGGVGYEAMIVTGELVRNLGTNKFIPVVRQTAGKFDLPKSVSTRFFVDLSEDKEATHKFEMDRLLRELHQAPANPKPVLGSSPFVLSQPSIGSNDANWETQPVNDILFSRNPAILYKDAAHIAEAGKILDWRNLVAKARNLAGTNLQDWVRNTHAPGDTGALVEQTVKGITSFAPLFCVAFAGIGSGRSGFANQSALIDEVLNPSSWQRSGLTVVVSLPEAAAFFYQALAGSLYIYTGQYAPAIQMIRAEIKLPTERDSAPLWRRHSIVGWPGAFAGNSEIAWSALASLPEQWPWLCDIFASPEDFRVALVAYYMFLNVNEYVHSLIDGVDLTSDEESHQPTVLLDTPLQFMKESDDVRRRAYNLLIDNLDEFSKLWRSLGVTNEVFAEGWRPWIGLCSRWDARSRLFGNVWSMPHERLGKDVLALASS